MLYLKLVDKDLPEVFYIFFKFQKFGLVWLQKKVSYGQKYTFEKSILWSPKAIFLWLNYNTISVIYNKNVIYSFKAHDSL